MDAGRSTAEQLLAIGLRALSRHDMDAVDEALVLLEREEDGLAYRQLAEAFIREAAR